MYKGKYMLNFLFNAIRFLKLTFKNPQNQVIEVPGFVI